MSWDGLEPSKRVCAGCGAKLTLAHDMPLWFEGDRLVWHFACKLKQLWKAVGDAKSAAVQG